MSKSIVVVGNWSLLLAVVVVRCVVCNPDIPEPWCRVRYVVRVPLSLLETQRSYSISLRVRTVCSRSLATQLLAGFGILLCL